MDWVRRCLLSSMSGWSRVQSALYIALARPFGQAIKPAYSLRKIEVRAAVKDMVDDANRASEIMDGIRALFRGVDPRQEAIDLNEVVTDVLRALHEELDEHRVTVRIELTPKMLLVQGNRHQLGEVVFNLVHNAVEPSKLSSVFDAFFTTKKKGMGLGLAICCMIALHHGGRLTASSNGRDGALFPGTTPCSRTRRRGARGHARVQRRNGRGR